MRILALDQARNCGFSIFDTEGCKLYAYGLFSYPNAKYTFAKAVMNIERDVERIINTNEIDAVFIEGIQLRKNPKSFACLAQLQGVLINLCEKRDLPYVIVQPTSWQSYCGAKGRNAKDANKEIDAETNTNMEDVNLKGKKASKQLSIQYVKEKYKIDTCNDNIADAVCIGTYAANNIGKLNFKENDND